MLGPTVEDLREVNRHLQAALATLDPSRGAPTLPDRQDLSRIRAELKKAETILAGAPERNSDAAMQEEMRQYRCLLGRLAQLLPSVHARLRVEKTRLEAAGSRILAAAAWAERNRQIL